MILIIAYWWECCLLHAAAGAYDVTLVSPRNYFLYTPLLPSAATGTVEPRSIVDPVRSHIPDTVCAPHLASLLCCPDPHSDSVLCCLLPCVNAGTMSACMFACLQSACWHLALSVYNSTTYSQPFWLSEIGCCSPRVILAPHYGNILHVHAPLTCTRV